MTKVASLESECRIHFGVEHVQMELSLEMSYLELSYWVLMTGESLEMSYWALWYQWLHFDNTRKYDRNCRDPRK